MARTYRRDARGRFAGGGGGSGGRRGTKLPAPAARKVGSAPQRRRGLLTQRAAVKSTKAKLAAKDPADRTIKGQLSRRSQKGAVTKASKALAAAQQSGRVRLSGRIGLIVKKPKGKTTTTTTMSRTQKPTSRPLSNEAPISSYVRGVRSARKNVKSGKPSRAGDNYAHEYRLSRVALSRRIQRERGRRAGLKTLSLMEAITV
jgi:hypothetical protein